MQTTQNTNLDLNGTDLDRIMSAIAKPGVVFSEPVRIDDRMVITASHVAVRKGRFSARPLAVISVSSAGVNVKYIRSRQPIVALIWGFLILSILGTIPVIYAPPWRPSFNLFNEVRLLLRDIRNGE